MERDAFYMIGEERGEVKAQKRFVRNLLAKMPLTIKQIADLAEVTPGFVEKIKAKIASEQ